MELEAIINGLSRDEQLIAMEMLWNRISQDPESSTPPEWHFDIVAQRVEDLKKNAETFVDWKEAKKRLTERLQ